MATDYDNFGGKDFFTSLVKDFYQEIINDPILKPMYPEDDLDGAIERLTLFLMQYWGGPGTYSELRGHPRLRMRHVGFHIDRAAHDAWINAMRKAVDGVEIEPAHKEVLWGYLEMAAAGLVNQAD